MQISLDTIYGLDKAAHSLEEFQKAYDLGANADHSSEDPYHNKDANLSRAFIAGYEEAMIEEGIEDDC